MLLFPVTSEATGPGFDSAWPHTVLQPRGLPRGTGVVWGASYLWCRQQAVSFAAQLQGIPHCLWAISGTSVIIGDSILRHIPNSSVAAFKLSTCFHGVWHWSFSCQCAFLPFWVLHIALFPTNPGSPISVHNSYKYHCCDIISVQPFISSATELQCHFFLYILLI